MVYLTAQRRCSTTNLYDSVASSSSPPSSMIQNGLNSMNDYVVVGNHHHHHHLHDSLVDDRKKNHITKTMMMLPSKIHPSIRFHKLSSQRLHQSNWTLDHHNAEYAEDLFMVDDYDGFDDNNGGDASLLLLSPYSKSCYLMAQRRQSNTANNNHHHNTHGNQRQSLKLEERATVQRLKSSKSMMNLRNHHQQQQQPLRRPSQPQLIKPPPPPKRQSSNNNNNHHNHNHNNGTLRTKKTTTASSTCSSSSATTTTTTNTTATQSPVDDEDLLIVVDDDDDDDVDVDVDVVMVADVEDRTNGRHHHHHHQPIPSTITAFMLQQQQRTKEQILRAKHRASILWLIAKANDNGRIPQDLRDPFYRDHQGQDLLKPWITQRLANAELYGMALANIYGVPDYSSLGHHGILHLLTRRGVFSDQLGVAELGEQITETMLLKNCPIKLAAHMIIIECIMMLYIREILIPVKVMEVTSRFCGDDVYTELPPSTEPEDVALYWVNRACAQLNQEIARDHLLNARQQQQRPQQSNHNNPVNDDDIDDFQCPVVVPTLEEISDMCDGCSLYALLAFYCPEHVNWREICLKQDIAIADSIYNLQRVQYYCQELFPSDICFLMLEDFLYLPELIVPNFLAFIADLLFMFEIQPVDAVTPPYLRLYPEMCQDEYQPNYPQMLTPSEMRAKSLKSTWNNNDSFETSSGGSEYPANHQLYDRPSFTNSQRASSQLTLNYYQQPPQHAAGLASNSSRRNSLVNQKTLNRRSSLLSNGSELLHNHHLQSDGGVDGDGVYAEPSNVNDYGQPNTTNVNHLSTYFSSMNINSNHPHHSHLHQQPSNNNVINDNNEYEKNRSRASGGHLTDYFSSLSNINDPSMMPTMSNQYNNTTNTHVRAQRHHPNNADNVKQLLSHHHQHQHQHQHQHPDHYQQIPDSQTNSSDTSSLAEISEFQNDQIKAQLNEKRKQIEADRQNDRQKRAPLDIRQEVLKTLKSGGSHTHHNNTSHDGRSSVDDTDFVPTKNHNDDENLTFEIHELNPIRREKTFTSIPSSLVASASSSSNNNNNNNNNKTSTFVRKNLFSASEDLKASMSDLNYANAKDYYQNNNFETPNKNSVKNEPETPETPSAAGGSVVSPTVADKPKTINESPLEPSVKPVESSTTPPEQKQTPPPPQQPQQQQPPLPSATTVPRHRSQWGQPMIPLAGQHQPPLPPAPPPQPSSHPYPQPPAWSQTPPGGGGGGVGYETQPPPTWYHNHQSPYHHPMAAQQPSYPYGYGAPPPPPPPAVMHHHPYDPYHASAFIQPAAAAPPPPPPQPALPSQDPYMSPVGNYQPHAYHHHQIGSSYPNTQPGQIANNNAHMEHHNLLHQQQDANTNHNVEQQDSTSESIRKQQQQQSTKHQQQQQQQHLPHQNETFFIPFDGQEEDRTPKRSSGQRKSDGIESTRPNLIRTATQTLVSPAGVNNNSNDDRIKELYNVRRPSNPPVPPVSFVIAADSPDQDYSLIADSPRMNGTMLTNGNGDHHHHHLNEVDPDDDEGDDDGGGVHQLQRPHSLSFNTSKSEEEMAKKKEAIMKQSLRRRALQESKRLQKEQELAAKREQERLKREQMERKKEEEKEKRAFILNQYKRKKQLAEEIEKNGGVAALQGTVARSSSTLILNRTPGGGSQQPGPGSVTMRVRGSNTQQRPRPKSLHAALLDECQSALSTYSGSSSRLSSSRDEIDDLASHCGRMSSTASCASSRPHSAMSSQLCSSTAISTPTGGGPFGDGPFGLVGASDLTSGPTSNTFYQEYNGPKLFVKPSQKSNKALILNAINVVLAGTVNADTNRRVTEVINKCDSKYYLILFRNSGLQYRAIYSYNPEREEVLKLDGIGPRTVHNDMIDKFYKYNSGTKSFTAIQTKHLCVTIDAFTIHNHLWMSKAKQQQQQSTPRRFLP